MNGQATSAEVVFYGQVIITGFQLLDHLQADPLTGPEMMDSPVPTGNSCF